MPSYKLELRKRTGSTYGDIYYPKAHVNNIEGLLDGSNKINISLFPDDILSGTKLMGTTATLNLSALHALVIGSYTEDRAVGKYFVVPSDYTMTVDAQTLYLEDTEYTSGTVELHDGDWVMCSGYVSGIDSYLYTVINNTIRIVTTSTKGLMSAADKVRLDGIATGATVGTDETNHYTPSVMAGGMSFSNTDLEEDYQWHFDSKGHVVGVSSRNKQEASLTDKGIVELATDAETKTGTDTARATTPYGVKAAINYLQGLPVFASQEDANAAAVADTYADGTFAWINLGTV